MNRRVDTLKAKGDSRVVLLREVQQRVLQNNIYVVALAQHSFYKSRITRVCVDD
jgi:hypothetical protein